MISFYFDGREIEFYKIEAIYHELPEQGYCPGILVHESTDINRDGDFILFNQSLPDCIEEVEYLIGLEGISYYETMNTVHYLAAELKTPSQINLGLLVFRTKIIESHPHCVYHFFSEGINYYDKLYSKGKITYNMQHYIINKLLAACTENDGLASLYCSASGYKRSKRYRL